jgi:amino acid transporter
MGPSFMQEYLINAMNKNHEHKLAADSLGIRESIIMGTAGAAPAFSIAAATATLVAAVGVLAPGSILYCGIIMFGISLAFIHLNKVIVNAGASYAWISKIFGASLGFFAGWAVLVSSAVFMVSGSIPASTSTLLLVAPDLVNSPGWVAFTSILWISAISGVAIAGIKPTAYLQVVMTGFEVFVLFSIIVLGIIKNYHAPAHTFHFSWLSLTSFTPNLFAAGALIAVFFYWGWDVTLNLNEETKNTMHTPGLGAFWSVLIIILLYVTFAIASLFTLDDNEIQNAGTNIIFAVANKLIPHPWSYLAVIAVMISTIGTLQTTIVQFTRTLFAQARDGVIHPRYATLHRSRSTPWIAILLIWFLGVVFLLLSSNFPTVNLIIKDSVHVLGLLVAFYYSLTGFACAWYHRGRCNNLAEWFGYVIWPTLSALFLIFIGCISIPKFDLVTDIVGLGGILLGFIPLWLSMKRKNQK